MSKYQEIWNRRIRVAGNSASKFSGETMESLMREGGSIWKYQQSPHNTDAFREGWERTFGKKKEE